MQLPRNLATANMHLDPDFNSSLTATADAPRQGAYRPRPDDVVAFYSGLKPVSTCEHRLVYALVGLYRVEESVRAQSIPAPRWSENATLAASTSEGTDVVVRARSEPSGRLRRCIPIGEFRDRAYRVNRETLADWGGLSCRDGYLQRSAVLPTLLDPRRFMQWFEGQAPQLVNANNP